MKKQNYMIKEYNTFNIIMIILAISMFLLPFISKIINKLITFTYGCISYRYLGKSCPLCGFTRDMRNIIQGDVFSKKCNLLSMPAVVLGIFELIFRVKLLIGEKNFLKDKEYMKKIMKADFIYHGTVVLLFIIYVICFYKFNLARV